MKLPKVTKSLVLSLATPAIVSLVVPSTSVLAQGETETKIRLMSEALKAREAGDLTTAKKSLEELLAIAPTDATVQRLLNGVNSQIATGSSVVGGDAAPVAPTLVSYPPVAAPAPEVNNDAHDVMWQKVKALLNEGDTKGAREALDAYAATASDADGVAKVDKKITAVEFNPPYPAIEKASPNFIKDKKEMAALSAKGRSQYLAGDLDGAQESFRAIESVDVGSPEAKSFLARIANEKSRIGELNRAKTRAQMVEEVANSWQRPGVFVDRTVEKKTGNEPIALAKKLNSIVIPSVNFEGVELSKVVSTLSAVSEEYDKGTEGTKGVNIVLMDPTNKNPTVSLTLRNLTLKRILDLITDATGYIVEVQADTIVVRPSNEGPNSNLQNAFFSITKATVIRMTGMGSAGATPAVAADPFAAPAEGAAAAGGGAGASGESLAIQNFLEQAGVKFTTTPGSSLVYDGSAIIVNQTDRNIERIRNILNRYTDVKQVEIEAKFMEITEGALDEVGFDWAGSQNNRGYGVTDPNTLVTTAGRRFGTQQNTLSGAFTRNSVGNGDGSVVTTGETPVDIVNNSPTIPGAAVLGGGIGNLFAGTAVFGDVDVSVLVRALSQKQGTDLMSSPKVTVLSGSPASIVVAQEMRYPQSYGEAKSTVSAGQDGGAAISVTAGTPQEFTVRNVGVELKVTPTVEEDDYSITLDLLPKVTEFEGFVEYGGQNVALVSSGALAGIVSTTTVVAPSGFYQPIFTTREVTTKVTVWDGATLVMGGLTREEVKKTSSKVPILGDIPFLGRLFQSKGETTNKRNLLIFVTANLVSPGGSPKKQSLKNVSPSSTFQNPTLVVPSGPASRIGIGSK